MRLKHAYTCLLCFHMQLSPKSWHAHFLWLCLLKTLELELIFFVGFLKLLLFHQKKSRLCLDNWKYQYIFQFVSMLLILNRNASRQIKLNLHCFLHMENITSRATIKQLKENERIFKNLTLRRPDYYLCNTLDSTATFSPQLVLKCLFLSRAMQIKRRPISNIKCCAVMQLIIAQVVIIAGYGAADWELVCKYYKAAASASLSCVHLRWKFYFGCEKTATCMRSTFSPNPSCVFARVYKQKSWAWLMRLNSLAPRQIRDAWLYFYTLCFLTSDSKKNGVNWQPKSQTLLYGGRKKLLRCSQAAESTSAYSYGANGFPWLCADVFFPSLAAFCL